MNAKEYNLIAGAIVRTAQVTAFTERNKVKRDAKFAALHLLVADLIGTLSHEYPKTFDKDKFLKACGVNK